MKKIQNIFWILIGAGGIIFFIYKLTTRVRTDHFINENSVHTKAVIINEKNYNGNSRVKLDFTYSYSFFLNGKQYTGDSQDPTLQIGDTIDVEYVQDKPYLNKPLHAKQ